MAGLMPAAYNPRKITDKDLARLGRSMKRFGDLSGIVKNLTTGNLVGGHQRVKHFDPAWPIIIKRWHGVSGLIDKVGTTGIGHIETPFGRWNYREVRWPIATEKAANIAANAHGGEFDMKLLGSMIKDLQAAGEDLDITGLEMHQVERMLDNIVEDEPPALPKKPITRAGDLWILGEHRLLCGSATITSDYAKLMGADRARMIFTDPPWNVDVGHGRRAGIKNDDMPAAQFAEFLTTAIDCMSAWFDGDIYVVMASREWPALDLALRGVGLRWAAVISWVKDSFVLGRGNYHRRFEPIWYGWRDGQRSSFCGARDQDDVWEIARPKASAEHPTMKPIELVARALINSSDRGDVVLDPFGGSGSLIMAAEQTGRRGRSIELDPAYCDVIVKRWEVFTGKKATKGKL